MNWRGKEKGKGKSGRLQIQHKNRKESQEWKPGESGEASNGLEYLIDSNRTHPFPFQTLLSQSSHFAHPISQEYPMILRGLTFGCHDGM